MIPGALLSYILIVACFEALGQSSIAFSRKTQNIVWLLVGMACYTVVAWGLYKSYAYKGVGIVNALWSSISIIIMIAIGHTLFGERMKTTEWIGVVLIVIGILFINA